MPCSAVPTCRIEITHNALPQARALSCVQGELLPSGLSVVVYGAYRPWSELQATYHAAPAPKRRLMPNPADAAACGLSRGTAIEIQLCRVGSPTELLPMPTAFGDFIVASASIDTTGQTLIPELQKNWMQLVKVMAKHGLQSEPSAWWQYEMRDCSASLPIRNDVLSMPVAKLVGDEEEKHREAVQSRDSEGRERYTSSAAASAAGPSAAAPSRLMAKHSRRDKGSRQDIGLSLKYYASLLRMSGSAPSDLRTGYEFQPRLPLASCATEKRNSHPGRLAAVKGALRGSPPPRWDGSPVGGRAGGEFGFFERVLSCLTALASVLCCAVCFAPRKPDEVTMLELDKVQEPEPRPPEVGQATAASTAAPAAAV